MYSPPKESLSRAARFSSGQSLVESCIVMAVLCLVFMGFFQVSQVFMAREILNFAAGRGARARSVGFNDFMVDKTVLVGTIANAGRMVNPEVGGGPGRQRAMERSRIPLYLGAERYVRLSAILDYEDWRDIHHSYTEQTSPSMLSFRVAQAFPLRFPLHRAFYRADAVNMTGEVRIDNHYPLYLEAGYAGDGEPDPE